MKRSRVTRKPSKITDPRRERRTVSLPSQPHTSRIASIFHDRRQG
jgi:hypothetical protein